MFRILLTLQISLISIFANSQSLNTYINREEIVNRLNKYLHQDKKGHIEFYDVNTKEKIKDIDVEIIEKAPEKFNSAKLVGKAVSTVNTENPIENRSSYFKLKEGGIAFDVKIGMDYQINLKQDGFVHQEYCINWRELLLNKEVGLVVKKVDCMNLNGLVTSKNVLFDLTVLKLKLIDKLNKKERILSINAWGAFALFLEYNTSYLLEFYDGNIKKQSIELPPLKKNQPFLNVISSTEDYDFVLQESSGARVILPTKLWNNTDYQLINYNKQSLLNHFLEDNSVEMKRGLVFQLSNYNYNYVKLEFSKASLKEFDLLDQLLHLYPTMKISINVHTDSEGSTAFNQRFTYDIAEKINRYLCGRGIEKSRILSRGMGEAFPLIITDPSLNEKEKDLRNRRVEVEVLEF